MFNRPVSRERLKTISVRPLPGFRWAGDPLAGFTGGRTAMNEIEVWKDVPGFDNYQISTLGRLCAKPRVIERVRYGKIEIVPKQRRLINATLDSCGYPQVKLYCGPKQYKSFKLHKVVALAFLDNPDSLPFINHKDGNKRNPRLSNLERCTAQHNTRHAWANGLCVSFKGENQGNSKLKDVNIPIIRAMAASGASNAEIASHYNVTEACIYYVVKRITWKHVA